ncbi:hypothetical protein ICW40_09190, partial [Actinotalea ferrariae]|uniref:hypothetical protein n=1 Tax=Actinotalea ferrariae TaxID=1386098 RepID=UPI001C8B634D
MPAPRATTGRPARHRVRAATSARAGRGHRLHRLVTGVRRAGVVVLVTSLAVTGGNVAGPDSATVEAALAVHAAQARGADPSSDASRAQAARLDAHARAWA